MKDVDIINVILNAHRDTSSLGMSGFAVITLSNDQFIEFVGRNKNSFK